MSLFQTPHHDKMNRICDKLNHIQSMQVTQKVSKLDLVEQRIRSAENRLEQMVENYNKKLTLCKEELSRLQKESEDETRQFESALEHKNKEVSLMEFKIKQRLEQEILARRESDQRVTRLIEERFAGLRNEVGQESKVRQEETEQVNQNLQNELPRSYESIRQERDNRDKNDKQIVKRVGEEMERIREQLAGEQVQREENENIIFETMKDLVNRVKSELEVEKKEREQSEENILSLIEDACTKLSALQL